MQLELWVIYEFFTLFHQDTLGTGGNVRDIDNFELAKFVCVHEKRKRESLFYTGVWTLYPRRRCRCVRLFSAYSRVVYIIGY